MEEIAAVFAEIFASSLVTIKVPETGGCLILYCYLRKKNYRVVSLTSVVGKPLEGILIYQCLERQGLDKDSQHTFVHRKFSHKPV